MKKKNTQEILDIAEENPELDGGDAVVELSIELSDKSKEILAACSNESLTHITVSTGRQCSKTTTGMIAGFQFATKRVSKTGFFLPTYKQCKNIFRRYKLMLEEFGDLVSFVAAPDFLITFWNGSTIQFFTADNDNFRGNTFTYLIVDEACFVKDDIWTVMEACVAVSLSKSNLSERGKVLLLSTPKSKNWFYNMTKDDEDTSKVIKFTSEEGGLISKEVLSKIKKRIPEAIYRNEYLGEFLDSGAGLFKYIPCISKNNIRNKNGQTAGLDLASKSDYTVLTIQDSLGNVICIERWRHQEWNAILNAVISKLKEYNSPVVYVETNGVGQMPYEYIRTNYRGVTQAWVTSNDSKNNIIQKLILDFNTRGITIPDVDFLKDELDNFTCEWKNGKPVYGGSNGFHDDSVMSLAICNYSRVKVKKVKPTLIQRRNNNLR